MTDAAARSGAPAPGGGARMPLEALVRNLAAITAVFYVVGFLATNSYLYTLGVTDFSLLRTRFVLTGILTLTPLLLALTWGVYAAVDVDIYSREGGLSRRGYLIVLGDVAIPFLLYFAMFAWAAENDVATSARDAALLSVICTVVVLALLGAVYSYRASDRRPVSRMLYRGKTVSYERFSQRFGVPDVFVETMVIAVGATILLLIYISIFGEHFYPAIQEQIGGGRPRTVQLLFSAEAVAAAREIGFAVDADTLLSPPVKLLWQGEETYVIRLPGADKRSVVQINSGLIDGLVIGARMTPVAGEDDS